MIDKGPDFLVVGAQRAGTTWLHRVLRQHPALWLPPVKELHYFDKLDAPRTILDVGERRRLKLRGFPSLDPWFVRYWLGRRSDAWYAALFREARATGLIGGELTPAYAILDEEVLRRVRCLNDKIKLIFVMRDPVERAWSAVNNAIRKGAGDRTTVKLLIERARDPAVAQRSAYHDTIRRLEAVFPLGQIHYCFFDDLRDEPRAMASRVFSFLGVGAGVPGTLEFPEAVNVAAGSDPIPAQFSRALAKDYLPSVRQLSERFRTPVSQWRVRYEALLRLTPVGAGAPSCKGGSQII